MSNGSNAETDDGPSTAPDTPSPAPSPSETGSGPSTPEGDSAAPSPSIRITTNLVQPEEVPPIPEGFELLYVTGKDVPARLEVFLVDGDMLYWAQRALLWRAPKDGSGEPVAFAAWETTNQGSMLLKDETYIYWHDGPHLKRKRRDTTDLAVTTPVTTHNIPWLNDRPDFRYRQGIEVIDYGASYSFAVMDGDGTHIYLAHPSCTPIHKVNIETLQLEILTFERPAHNGGHSALRLDGDRILCANDKWLFQIDRDGTEPRILHDGFTTVQSMTVAQGWAYVLERQGAGMPGILGIELNGSIIDYGRGPVGNTATPYGAPLQVDANRNRLYWGGGGYISSLDFMNVTFKTRGVGMNYAFASDENYLYWGGELNIRAENNVVTILRLHKDRLDVTPSPN